MRDPRTTHSLDVSTLADYVSPAVAKHGTMVPSGVFIWASPLIAPVTSAGSRPTASGFACPPNGDVQCSAGGARRVGNGSLSSCQPNTPAPERASYPRRLRLTRGSDLQKVLREGKRARTEHLEVRILASLLRHPRLGIIVPKHRRSIVERNRLKRRLREIVRCDILPLVPVLAVDLVIRAGPRAYEATFEMLRAELTAGVQQIVGRKAP